VTREIVTRFALSQAHGGSSVLEGARTFTRALGARLGRTVRLIVSESYGAMQRTMLTRAWELAWMPPFVYLGATGSGARILAVSERNGSLTYRSALVVKAEGRLHELDDLRTPGLRAAWTDPRSASGYIFPRMYLARQKIDPSRLDERFVGSPLAACAAVADGQADVCACFVSETSASEPEQLLADLARIYTAAPWRLRVLAVTDAIPSDALVSAPHVDDATAHDLATGLVGLRTTEEGREALQKMLFAERLLAPPQAFLAQLEALRPFVPPVE
jgi:phosphonate transport system substrate-binding protein